jgi:hypothetical protein
LIFLLFSHCHFRPSWLILPLLFSSILLIDPPIVIFAHFIDWSPIVIFVHFDWSSHCHFRPFWLILPLLFSSILLIDPPIVIFAHFIDWFSYCSPIVIFVHLDWSSHCYFRPFYWLVLPLLFSFILIDPPIVLFIHFDWSFHWTLWIWTSKIGSIMSKFFLQLIPFNIFYFFL